MYPQQRFRENKWEEMGVEKREEPGVTWHIQEMDKEDPISNIAADDV